MSTEAPSTQHAPSLLNYFFFVFLSLMMNLKVRVDAILPGDDESRDWAVSYAKLKGWKFGKDILFTHGPMSHLVDRCIDLGWNVYSAVGFSLICCVLIATAVCFFAASMDFKPLNRFLVGLILLGSVSIPAHSFYVAAPGCEDQLLLINLLLLLNALYRRNERVWLVLSAALSAVFIQVKLSLGVGSCVNLAIVGLLSSNWKTLPLRAGLAAGTFSLVLLITWLFNGQSLYLLPEYVRWGYHIVSTYPHTLSLDIRHWQLLTAMYVVFSLFCIGWAFTLRAEAGKLWLVFLFPLFTAFKHSVVRMGNSHLFHFVHLGQFTLLVLLVFSLRRYRFSQALSYALGGFVLLSVAPLTTDWQNYYLTHGKTLPHEMVAVLKRFPDEGLQSLNRLAHLPEIRKSEATQSRKALGKRVLPRVFLERIGQESIDVWSFDLSYLPANQLNWRPRPTITSIIAGNTLLDDYDNRFMQSDHAPRFLLLDRFVHGLEGSSLYYYEPRTQRTILSRYALVGVERGVALLERQPTDRYGGPVVLSEARVSFGQTVKVPVGAPDDLLALEVEVTWPFVHKIKNFLFKPNTFHLHLYYENGEHHAFRFFTPSSSNGLLISRLPIRRFQGLDRPAHRQIWNTRECRRCRILGEQSDRVGSKRISKEQANGRP
ncbi:MAG: hypothetical protein KDD51_00925 [Bdellovibrionales bacterium]|nr:hypothetical protein [Bdellovibrionales bacterium]